MRTLDNRIVGNGQEFYVGVSNESEHSKFCGIATSLGYVMRFYNFQERNDVEQSNYLHSKVKMSHYPYFYNMYTGEKGERIAFGYRSSDLYSRELHHKFDPEVQLVVSFDEFYECNRGKATAKKFGL